LLEYPGQALAHEAVCARVTFRGGFCVNILRVLRLVRAELRRYQPGVETE
jgi:hypothetical protein